MSKPHHRAFVLDQFGGDEYLGRYFPSTRQLVERSRAAHEVSGGPKPWTLMEIEDPDLSTWYPLVNITYLALQEDGRTVIGQGIVTLPQPAAMITTSFTLFDNLTGTIFGVASVPNQYNLTTQTIEITGTLPEIAGIVSVTATLTAQILLPGSTVAKQITTSALLTGTDIVTTQNRSPNESESVAAIIPVQSITVLNPNHNAHPTRDYIKVGLNRTSSQVADCDYYYQYGNEGSKPIVGLQVNGSAQLLSGFTVAATPNFTGSCVLFRRSDVGAGATLAFPVSKIPSLCSGGGNAVSWNIGPSWFSGAPWDQNQVIDLDFTLNFNIVPNGTASLRVTSVPQAVTTPSNLAALVPIQFVWGCVARGTEIRMEDGSTRRIETLRVGERVADGQGGSLRISEVWTGHEAKPLYRLVTASGAEVLLTEEHPVPTADGVVLARDLVPGMVVTTARGDEALCTVETVSHDGPVCNLDLLPDDAVSASDVDDDAITGFVAGGILVGDNRMQGVWSKRANRRVEVDPLELLGQDWRLDIVNSERLAQGLPLVERLSV
ncbi:Hint domain-containing protein [Magnetospirillum fulvum]|nr:Hint domain-containing protein [Magnetospirillum fulvum]